MRHLDPHGLQALLRGAGDGTTGSVAAPLLLDVREPWEVALAPLRVDSAGTLAIPMNTLPERLGELDPAQPIVCVCHHGVRSAQVAAFLVRQGFALVHNLDGGTDAWSVAIDPSVVRY